MKRLTFLPFAIVVCVLMAATATVRAQVDLTGTFEDRLYEDYIERGPGSDLGDYTGMPLTDDGRAKALAYTSNMPMTIERQCLAQAPWVGLYRPLAYTFWSVNDETTGEVIAWVIGGNYLRDTITIWMDGREHPSKNAYHPAGGFATGKWEGNTLAVQMTHAKAAWIRRGNGIPGSDESTFTVHITRHEDLLTVTTTQEDPHYLTEPHVVSRVWQHEPNAFQTGSRRTICNTATEIPYLEGSGQVPHYLPSENPEEYFMTREYNLPAEAAMGFSRTLYPEYRNEIADSYLPPESCGRYCCGWIERQGMPGGAPNLTCNDGGFGQLGPRGRREVGEEVSQ